jgi:hypothetical protein
MTWRGVAWRVWYTGIPAGEAGPARGYSGAKAGRLHGFHPAVLQGGARTDRQRTGHLATGTCSSSWPRMSERRVASLAHTTPNPDLCRHPAHTPKRGAIPAGSCTEGAHQLLCVCVCVCVACACAWQSSLGRTPKFRSLKHRCWCACCTCGPFDIRRAATCRESTNSSSPFSSSSSPLPVPITRLIILGHHSQTVHSITNVCRAVSCSW